MEDILVIDDEPSVADALRLILEDQGYRVTVARTGRAGLEAARQKRFRLVITDLRLPDISGREVVEEVCRVWPGSVIIMITSYCTTEVCAAVHKCGAAAVLMKPFAPAEIIKIAAAATPTTHPRAA